MNRRKLEALAEALVNYSGYRNPESAVYFARNPGGLRAYSQDHPRDAFNNRVFRSVIDGMQALLYDVQYKLSGQSRHKLTPENTLTDLAMAYFQPNTVATAWSRFLRQALRDNNISPKTPLQYFLEE